MTIPYFSVIVPVYNGGVAFVHCLDAIQQSQFKDWELIVVDDGSTDDSATVAASYQATVLRNLDQQGPGGARNLGATIAKGKYLCFIDADCEVYPETFARLADKLDSCPRIDAVFGSYDDAPKARNCVAQFKNLMHHYVHQTAQETCSTFWAGCGAIRREAFLNLGGFDVQRYPRPSIEDIDLGYRLRQSGGTIALAKQAQVKHHKAWTLFNLIKTDVCDRGIPWTQLLLSQKNGLMNDLNLKVSSRVSVVFSFLIVILCSLSFLRVESIFLAGILAIVLFIMNCPIYRFFYKKRGIVFLLQTIPLHWLYFFYSGVAFVLGHLYYWRSQQQPNLVRNPELSA